MFALWTGYLGETACQTIEVALSRQADYPPSEIQRSERATDRQVTKAPGGAQLIRCHKIAF